MMLAIIQLINTVKSIGFDGLRCAVTLISCCFSVPKAFSSLCVYRDFMQKLLLECNAVIAIFLKATVTKHKN